MHVIDYWKSGRKYFEIELESSEAKLCLSSVRKTEINLTAYNADLFPKAKVFHVDYLKVSNSGQRNKGYGTAILGACIEWASITKNVIILDAIPLDSDIESNRLIRFYLKHGFKLAGVSSTTAMIFHTRKLKRKTMKRRLKVDSGVKNLL